LTAGGEETVHLPVQSAAAVWKVAIAAITVAIENCILNDKVKLYCELDSVIEVKLENQLRKKLFDLHLCLVI